MWNGRFAGVASATPRRGSRFFPWIISHATASRGTLGTEADAHDLSSVHGSFDAIILSDLVNDLWDVQGVFEQVRALCNSHTRLILNFYSGLWQFPLTLAQNINVAVPMLGQNWLTRGCFRSAFLSLAGFDVIRQSQEILWPFPLGGFANKFLVRLWPFRDFALSNFVVAKPQPETSNEEPSVSIIVPARKNRVISKPSLNGRQRWDAKLN